VSVRTLLLLVLSIGSVQGLRANTALCINTTLGFTITPCGQTFVANDFLNYGAPVSSGGLGEATNPGASNLGTTVAVSANGVQVAITSDLSLERADNTVYAWNPSSSSWVIPTLINTFGGQFNAPSEPTYTGSSGSAYGPNNYPYQYGDPLLGVTSPNMMPPEMTFSFSQQLYGVALKISSVTNPNFVAILDAYNSLGHLIGSYDLDTNGTGVGGLCSSLNSSTAPVPCNDAPVIQFYDPQGHIASIVLTVNDMSGFFVDGLSLDSGAPEPETAPLIGGGLIVLALIAKTRLQRSRKFNP
jgi:hypothetical protein